MKTIRQFRFAAIAVALTAITCSAYASALGPVTVASVSIISANVATINFSSIVTSSPACAVYPQIRMSIDISTNRGKAALSSAQGALLSGRKVTVGGAGTCTLTGGVEDLATIILFQ
jgi:hypothetical protein